MARQKQQLARQEAIQEAILKEQERVRRMEQSMKLIELGTGIATGSLGGRSTPKMQSQPTRSMARSLTARPLAQAPIATDDDKVNTHYANIRSSA